MEIGAGIWAGFAAAMALAMASDLRSMTIPNRLCLALALAFPLAAIAAGYPPVAIAAHAALALVVLALLLPLFAFGWMGGGDVKLIAAVALWFGPLPAFADFLLAMALCGGALTIAFVAARRVWRPTTGRAFLDRLLDPGAGVPYGLAIGAAALATFPHP